MPIGSAFHERTLPLCESLNYRDWAGYYAVSAYETHHEHEYNAIRNAAALIDVSPLYKYIVTGREATRLVDRLITRDATKLAVGQPAVAKLERRADMYVSNLRRYVEALGGTLQITAHFPDGVVTIADVGEAEAGE